MTDSASSPAAEHPQRLLTFRSGGWALLLAALLIVGIVAWRVSVMVQTMSIPVVGDGQHVESYGFDLTPLLVPREQLVAAGFPKDGLPIMESPQALTLAGAEELGAQMREQHLGKFMVDTQRVLGVSLNGEHRAYPLKILTWHEVINDELGGIPIAVTFNPLCYSAVVFDRRSGEEVLDFGVSGLLYNSNLVMYDRRPESKGESLWSQLEFRAIAGPAAERRATLRVLPCELTLWRDWTAQHPATTVLAPDQARLKLYKRTYGEYYGTDEIRFPVAPLPPYDRPYKTPIVAVRASDGWHVFTWEQVIAQAGPDGVWETEVSGQPIRWHYQHEPALRADPTAVWMEPIAGPPPPVVYSFWFAWYATHPDTAL